MPKRISGGRESASSRRRLRAWKESQESSKLRLMAAALKARRNAAAPYSGFKVGAALLTKGGRIFSGANVESASFGLTCCAERIALFKALSEGKRKFTAIAIAAAIG